ncbi:Hypothetical protein PBC10988_20340 [Planctomycetales bacterium 10988]|nr:Hypothetical protein PBC10988_20340 [Planctomycetales bacterium 10988]
MSPFQNDSFDDFQPYGFSDKQQGFPDSQFSFADEEQIEAAKNLVKGPSLVLIFLGLISLLSSLFFISVGVSMVVAPPEDEKVQQVQPNQSGDAPANELIIEINEKEQHPEAAFIFGFLGCFFSLTMIIGGWKMYTLSNYLLAMVGAIIALIPCYQCCYLGVPVGIWALVILSREDVKQAFAAKRNSMF